MNNIKKSVITTAACVAGALSLFASPGANDMDAVISAIVSDNPEVKSRKAEISRTRLEAADENSLANPEVGVTQVWGKDGVGNKFEVEVSQSFDWPGLYRARSRAAKAGTSAAAMLYRSSCLDIALQAKLKLVELVHRNQELALLRRIKENTDTVLAKVEEGYRRGELTILDSKKMRIEQFRVANDIVETEEAISRLKADIQALCPGTALDLGGFSAYPVEPRLSEDEYVGQIAALDPVIAAGKFSEEHEMLNAGVARSQRFPGFSVGYIYQAEMGDKFNGFSVSMSLPFFQNRKTRAVALSRAEDARLANVAAEASRRADVRATIIQMNLHERQIQDYERVFGDNSYLSLLLQAYQGGQINVIDYLSEVNYFYDITRAYLNCKFQYSTALASLNRYSLLDLAPSK